MRRTIPLPDYRMGQPYSAGGGYGGSIVRNDPQFIKDTYDRVTWVYKAVHAVAHNAARLKVEVLKGDAETGTPIKTHPLVDLLNWRSSPYTQEQAYVYRYRVSAQLELCTRGVFVEKVMSRGGDVLALHLYPPGICEPIPDPLKFVRGYYVTVGNMRVEVPAERILWIKNPHPSDPYRSMTSFEAAGMAIDTDWLAHLYNANFMRTDGRGANLIAVKGGLEDDDADEIKSWFQGGVASAGETHVVEADEITHIDLAKTPRDAQYVEMRGLSKEEIFIGAGVPESVAGNASGRTFDNADAEKSIFWEEKMLGHLELLGGAYDLIDGKPDTFVVHDVSGVSVLQRSEIARRQEMRDEVKGSVRSIDSYLEEVGEKALNLPETKVPLISVTLVPVGEEKQPVPPALAPHTGPVPPELGGPADPPVPVVNENDKVPPPVVDPKKSRRPLVRRR